MFWQRSLSSDGPGRTGRDSGTPSSSRLKPSLTNSSEVSSSMPTATQTFFKLHCVKCNKPASSGYQAFCDACDGIMDVQYDPKRVELQDSTNPYVRFAALLPVRDPERYLPKDSSYTPTIHAK